MTNHNDLLHDSTSRTPSAFWTIINKLSGVDFLKNLKIGSKLTIGFGILVVLTLLVAAVSYLGSSRATVNIDRTDELRVPTALASSLAQADLLRMLGSVRGYLALGDKEFLEEYLESRQAFESDLDELTRLSPNLNQESKKYLDELKTAFLQWADLPERLFALRDDQLEREPAYRLLATEGSRLGGMVLIGVQSLIEAQAQSSPSSESLSLLKDMASFQGSFAAMLSGLRGYATTRNRIYRQEYDVNLTINRLAWERLIGKKQFLSSSQQATLNDIIHNSEAFLLLPDKMFNTLEGDHYREDLYLFRTKTIPLTQKMQLLLSEMTTDQQTMLQTDLNRGRTGLAMANHQILAGGIIALILGLGFAFVLRENIAGPIRRLTHVAYRIQNGDLEAQAPIESADETGILATTFNNMTAQLRQTLLQVRKEKKRADDLLNVVIPIGVRLSSEKDFNRLLESMLLEAKSFCNADAGTLYLCTDDHQLKYTIVRNDSKQIALGGTTGQEVIFAPLSLQDPITGEPNYSHVATSVALSGTTANVPHPQDGTTLSCYSSQSKILDEYQIESLLTIPLKNNLNQVIGVLQLINAQDPETKEIIPFDQNLQQLMESFSLLAVAALEAYIREQSLKQEIRQLRIEIDEAKRQKQVKEIVDSDFFQDLQAKARSMRRRGGPTE